MPLNSGNPIFKPNWSFADGRFKNFRQELSQGLALAGGVRLGLLKQLRVDLDVELRPSHVQASSHQSLLVAMDLAGGSKSDSVIKGMTAAGACRWIAAQVLQGAAEAETPACLRCASRKPSSSIHEP